MSITINPPSLRRQKRPYGHLLSKQQGISLLEVLIAVVVTSFGLLGIAGLQLASVNTSTIASVNTQAMISIDEIVGQIRANPDAAKEGEFNINLGDTDNLVTFSTNLEPTGSPSVSELGAYNWFRNLDQSIPGVKAGVHCDATSGICAVKIELPLKIDSVSSTNMTQIVSIQL